MPLCWAPISQKKATVMTILSEMDSVSMEGCWTLQRTMCKWTNPIILILDCVSKNTVWQTAHDAATKQLRSGWCRDGKSPGIKCMSTICFLRAPTFATFCPCLRKKNFSLIFSRSFGSQFKAISAGRKHDQGHGRGSAKAIYLLLWIYLVSPTS